MTRDYENEKLNFASSFYFFFHVVETCVRNETSDTTKIHQFSLKDGT